jgi:hypothetical protein
MKNQTTKLEEVASNLQTETCIVYTFNPGKYYSQDLTDSFQVFVSMSENNVSVIFADIPHKSLSQEIFLKKDGQVSPPVTCVLERVISGNPSYNVAVGAYMEIVGRGFLKITTAYTGATLRMMAKDAVALTFEKT